MSARQTQVIELRAAGLRNCAIAKQLDISECWVSLLLKGCGIPSPARKNSPEDIERTRAMATAFRSGQTLQAIGEQYGITRERVRQIIGRLGCTRKKGGAHARVRKNSAERAARKDEAALKRWGCTYAQYRWLLSKNGEKSLYRDPVRAFTQNRNNARLRGIPWKFKLWDWWQVWQESGKWNERGRGKGYVMARRGDAGAYEVGNVYIATAAQNTKDSYVSKPYALRNHRRLAPAERAA